jgi:hypothetical protein
MNFIHQEFISDLTICDKLIELFKTNSNHWSLGKAGKILNPKVKKSTDMAISPNAISSNELVKFYIDELHRIAKNYIKNFNFCNKNELWGITEDFNIQYYNSNEAFYGWHCERSTSIFPVCNRHLVWMTYLNDVENDGETEFYYQKLKIKPKKGLTLIWPTDWTHTHRGIPSKKDEKYIITGWFNFIE